MSVKEIWVEAQNMIGVNVPVRFGYEPFKKENIDFISLKKPPYLFMAIVSQKGKTRIVLGDARVHTEFKMAIQRDMGRLDSCELGQAIFNNGFLKRIILRRTSRIDISDGEAENKILSIISAFNPEFLHPEGVSFTFDVIAGGIYEYFPQQGKIVKGSLGDYTW